jgi:anti-sigma B factor antagonist
MDFKHEIVNNKILIIRMSGDLIGENNGPELIQLINGKIEEGFFHCAVDLSDVRYMNSSGIGILITLLTKFRNHEGEMALIRPSDNIRKLLIITKLNKIFSISETREEAIRVLNS